MNMTPPPGATACQAVGGGAAGCRFCQFDFRHTPRGAGQGSPFPSKMVWPVVITRCSVITA
jgi:hypothetical protein